MYYDSDGNETEYDFNDDYYYDHHTDDSDDVDGDEDDNHQLNDENDDHKLNFADFDLGILIDETDKRAIIQKSSDWTSPALSQFYNKDEKRSTFSDIMVKVQTQVYHLDKSILALKSAYFEALFTGNFEDGKYDEIEIRTIDEDTFSSIVDYIYGADLNTVLDDRNFASIFMAMDYLQMEIDARFFTYFIAGQFLFRNTLDNSALFQLRSYLLLLPKFRSILVAIYRRLAENLTEIGTMSEFLSLPPNALSAVLSGYNYGEDDDVGKASQEKHYIVEVCAEWICHDFQKRLPHIVDLVNAVKRRFGISFAIGSANYKPFAELDETRRKERVRKYFNRLLNYCADIRLEPPVTKIVENFDQYTSRIVLQVRNYGCTSEQKTDYAAKWRMNIKQKNFCDVLIRAGDEVFRLHRIKLSMESPYFYDLFSQSPHQDEYVLEAAIDAATFKIIVDYVYYEEINLRKESKDVFRLLRSCSILQMVNLKNQIYECVKDNLNLMNNIAFEFLYYTIQNEEFYDHLDQLKAAIGDTWEEICRETEFYDTSIDALECVVNLPNSLLNDEHGLLNICSKWIHHDVKNRYQFIPKLAQAINHRPDVVFEKYNSTQQENLCSLQQIEDQLKSILISTQLVSTRTNLAACDPAQKLIPSFIILSDEEISIVNSDLDEITSLLLLSPIRKDDKYTRRELPRLSAVIINDDLFMLFDKDGKFSFQVYNFRSKKLNSLSCNFRTDSSSSYSSSNFHLINRNNDLYFCSSREKYIWKYSRLLNRWIRVFKMQFKNDHFVTSNGKFFYEVFLERSNAQWVVQVRLNDFEKQSSVILQLPSKETGKIRDVSIIDGNLAILFDHHTGIYRQEPETWEVFAHPDKIFSTFKQFGDSILYVTDPSEYCLQNTLELHSFSIGCQQWRLKKKLQMKFKKIVPILSV